MNSLPSSRSSFSHPAGIRVNAVYPAFAIVSWDPPPWPRGRAGAPSMERAAWRYTVEWSCSCAQSPSPSESGAIPSPLTFAVIPVHHPDERFHVQVTAKGMRGGAVAGPATLKTSFRATCTVRFPWLRPSALYSRLLHDCLYFASNGGSAEAELTSSERVIATHMGVWWLDCDLVAAAHRVVYAAGPCPLDTRAVIVLAAVAVGHTAAVAKGAERVSNAQLVERLDAENGSLVLCGVGELGRSAALATYAVMAALRKAGEPVEAIARRIYGVAYGAARPSLLEAPAALLEAGCVSGNVLFYSGVMAPVSLDGGGCAAFTNAMFASGLPPALSGRHQQQLSASFRLLPPSAAGSGCEDGGALNVPLGVRSGPVRESGTGRLMIAGEASTLAMPTDEERCECIDTAHHLSLLRGVTLTHCTVGRGAPTPMGADGAWESDWLHDSESAAAGTLRPAIDTATLELADRTSSLLRVYIGGRHLQFHPCVTCITHPGDSPLAMAVVSCSPCQVVCEASLIANICAASFAAAAVGAASAPTALAVSVLLQTDMGFTEHSVRPLPLSPTRDAAHALSAPPVTDVEGSPQDSDARDARLEEPTGSYIVALPRSVTELLFKACRRQTTADAWIIGSPASLIDAVVSSIPFYIFSSTGRTPRAIDANIAASRSVTYMCQLATVAELTSFYRTRKPQNSLMALVEKVASKISNQTELLPGSITLATPPQREECYLQTSLRELAMSSSMPISAYLARMISWKRRLFTGLPNLNENFYRLKLQWLLLVVSESDLLCREQPLTALELQLYSSVSLYLRRRLSDDKGHAFGAGTGGYGGLALGGDFVITDYLSFNDFFDLTHPLFLTAVPPNATNDEAEAFVVAEVGFLWAVCVLLQLRQEYTTAAHFLVAVTGCRGSGCSTVAAALAAVGDDLVVTPQSVGGGRPRVLVKQVPENALGLLRELMGLGVAVSVVVTAELPDFGGLAFSAITRSILSSVTDVERQRVHVALTKVDERLSLLAAEDATAPAGEDQVAKLVRAATVPATAAAAQSCRERLVPIPVALNPSVASVRAALRAVHSGVPEETFAAELRRQSVERLRGMILDDIEGI